MRRAVVVAVVALVVAACSGSTLGEGTGGSFVPGGGTATSWVAPALDDDGASGLRIGYVPAGYSFVFNEGHESAMFHRFVADDGTWFAVGRSLFPAPYPIRGVDVVRDGRTFTVIEGEPRILEYVGDGVRVETVSKSLDTETLLRIAESVTYDPGRDRQAALRASASTTTTVPVATTAPAPVVRDVTVTLSGPADATSGWWRDVLSIGYGDSEDQLGFDQLPGVGPEFAAVGPDGSWWVLDSQKHRVAVFDGDGVLQQAFDVGRVSAWDPTVLDDGTFVAIAFEQVVVIRGGQVRTLPLSEGFWLLTDDGKVIYGRTRYPLYPHLSITELGASVVHGVEWLRTRGGVEFRVDYNGETGEVAVEFNGDPPVRVRLVPHLADDPNTRIGVAPVEVVSGQDNTVSVLLVGADNDGNVAALASIAPDGTLTSVAPLPASYFDSVVDPSFGPTFGHLVVQPGTSTIFLVTTDMKGLHASQLTEPGGSPAT
ncbi:MAG: hypothetical protein GXP34_02395 [Actinobacteria bacterium]|nr:hypothetical protein [Actinomycetota bacterium]